MFKKIMIAYDDSPESERALLLAIDLARAVGAELKVVSVCEPPPSYLAFAVAAVAVSREQWKVDRIKSFEDRQQIARKTISEAGLFPDIQLLNGEEVGTIVGCARKHQADLLVLGMRKRRWVSGHTGHEIADASPCAILGVR